jgi:hypothetical protein
MEMNTTIDDGENCDLAQNQDDPDLPASGSLSLHGTFGKQVKCEPQGS